MLHVQVGPNVGLRTLEILNSLVFNIFWEVITYMRPKSVEIFHAIYSSVILIYL